MRTDPCKQCGAIEYYIKGKFSYCRPCHSEAQKRYLENKRIGVEATKQGPPQRTIEQTLRANLKMRCPKGHPYSGNNVRLESPKTGKLQRRCKTCERNRKRVAYGLLPERSPVRLTDILDSRDEQ